MSAKSANAYGGALGASWRSFLLAGEFYQIGVDQSKLPGMPSPSLGFNGGYVDAAWVVITGEPIPYDITRAAWSKPKVDRPVSLSDGDIGAWEIAARYSTVDLNSHVVPGVPQSVTGGIFGGRQQISAGTRMTECKTEVPAEFSLFTSPVLALQDKPQPVQIGQRFETIAARAQATW